MKFMAELFQLRNTVFAGFAETAKRANTSRRAAYPGASHSTCVCVCVCDFFGFITGSTA